MLSCARCRSGRAVIALLRRLRNRLRLGLRGVFVDPPLDLGPKMPQQALHRPSGAVAESADSMTLDLGRDLPQRVDLAFLGASFRHAREHAPHPAHAFAARRTLTAALVLVEVGNAR